MIYDYEARASSLLSQLNGLHTKAAHDLSARLVSLIGREDESRLMSAVHEGEAMLSLKGEFTERLHPRDNHGRFARKPGAHGDGLPKGVPAWEGETQDFDEVRQIAEDIDWKPGYSLAFDAKDEDGEDWGGGIMLREADGTFTVSDFDATVGGYTKQEALDEFSSGYDSIVEEATGGGAFPDQISWSFSTETPGVET